MIIEYAEQVIEVKSDGLFYWADKQSETLQGMKDLIDKAAIQTVKCKALWLRSNNIIEIVDVLSKGSYNAVAIVWVKTGEGMRKIQIGELYKDTSENKVLFEQIYKLWEEEKKASDERFALVKKLERLDLS